MLQAADGAGVTDLDQLLPAVTLAAAHALGAPVAVLLRRVDGRLRVVSQCLDGQSSLADRPLNGVAGVAALEALLETGVSAVLDGGDAWAAFGPEVAARAPRCAVASPLRFGGDGLEAILVAAAPTAHSFDGREQRLLEGVARVGELAIATAERSRRLVRGVTTDPLTGLADRSEFVRALGAASGGGVAVIALDVDRLRDVNEQVGFAAGDETLRRLAAVLASAAPDGTVVARTGGDEFALLLEGAGEEEAAGAADCLRQTLAGVVIPFGIVRVTMGVAQGGAGVAGREVWSWAVAALEDARERGLDCLVSTATGRTTAGSRLRRWGAVVDDVLACGRVSTVFQPVVRLRDRCVVGYEALSRPNGLAPGASVEGLFAAAHRAGRARDLDWICRRSALVNARPIPVGTDLFVNVSVWSLLDPVHDVDQLLMLCAVAGRSPSDVVLEISERELVSDVPRLETVLATYRREGFRFAVDDLGEGHSTLEVLATASPEFIKVARTLTRGQGRVGARAAIHSVAAFAEETWATVIAEGIEAEADAWLMADLGIDHGQGWHLGRPAALAPLQATEEAVPDSAAG